MPQLVIELYVQVFKYDYQNVLLFNV